MITERRVLLAWGMACVGGGYIIDHRAVVAVSIWAMGVWAIWLAEQKEG